jgi:hypothetical protein
MRFAVYFTPPQTDPLTLTASNWLGRDAFGGGVSPACAAGRLSGAEIERHTLAARRYGFHATIVAPFRLVEDRNEAELLQAFGRFCRNREPFSLGRLRIGRIQDFVALVLESDVPALSALEQAAVAAFNSFCAPPTNEEIARRDPGKLTAPQRLNLERYGYPYVRDEFRFHMTLAGPLRNDAEAADVADAAQEVFAPVLERAVAFDGLALFTEAKPGAPFDVEKFHGLGRNRERMSA